MLHRGLSAVAFCLSISCRVFTAQASEASACRALLIGNTAYQTLPQVPSAVLDLDLLRARLTRAGCDSDRIREVRNAPTEELRRVIESEFIPSVSEGDVVIFYFAGRAMQAEEANYLLGTDFAAKADIEIRDAAYLLNRAQTRLQGRKPSLVLMLVDGAYEDQSLAAVPGFAPGLAESKDVSGSIVIFSAAKDQPLPTAAANQASLLARTFSDLILRPGVTMFELTAAVKATVESASGGSQRPYTFVNYAGNFRFVEPPPPAAPPPPKTETKIVVIERKNRRQHKDDREYYVLIPKGTFQMGCTPDTESECEAHEKPRHKVEIRQDFWLGENEVQVASYQRFVKLNGLKMHGAPAGFDWKRDSIPIVMVPWEKASQYCAWLGGRLPTEAEWEYAVRAGDENSAFPMKDFSTARDAANFKGVSGNDTYDWVAPVQKFNKNAFGVYDMSGNVWEWVADWYSPTYYSEVPNGVQNPAGPASGKEHVIRGGSFDSDPRRHLRLSYRDKSGRAENKIGFRCLLPATNAIDSKLN